MPRDGLPDSFQLPTRNELIANYKRDFALRYPGTDIGANSDADARARLIADQLLPLYNNAALVADSLSDDNRKGTAIDEELEALGLPPRGEPQGAFGSVTVSASSAGGTIQNGDELIEPNRGLTYRAVISVPGGLIVGDGDQVNVQGKDTGPETNLEPGTTLQWSNPRPGIGQVATVYEQTNGDGLAGGVNSEDDETARARIKTGKRDRAAAGNEAHIIELAQATPGVPVERAFAYPCWNGPGTTMVAFTVRPPRLGGNRIPSELQRQTVQAYVEGQLNADDSIVVASVIAQNTPVKIEVDWTPDSPGWANLATWPAVTFALPTIDSADSPTVARISKASTDASWGGEPPVGAVIAVWDKAAGKFRRKQIASVADDSTYYTLTFATSAGASDVTYTPQDDDPFCPWADNIQEVADSVLGYFDKMGPGEILSTEQLAVYEEGRRKRRYPRSPKDWPSVVNKRVLTGLGDSPGVLDDIPSVLDADITTGDGLTTATGTPGVSVRLRVLDTLHVFPKS